MKLVALVGMTGAGKSEVSGLLKRKGFIPIRFGDATDEEIKKRGLKLNEANERLVREELREKYGMAAYAVINLPRIDKALKKGDVAIDGLYSWEEYNTLKDKYGEELIILAVWASPQTRYKRLALRSRRPLNTTEAAGRDKSEIENLNKGGPIALADYTINNQGSLEKLTEQVDEFLARL